MKRVLTVTSIISNIKVKTVDYLGRTAEVTTDRTLEVGQSVLVDNLIVVGVVPYNKPKVYKV